MAADKSIVSPKPKETGATKHSGYVTVVVEEEKPRSGRWLGVRVDPSTGELIGVSGVSGSAPPTKTPDHTARNRWRKLTAADVQVTAPSDPELLAELEWAEANWREIVGH